MFRVLSGWTQRPLFNQRMVRTCGNCLAVAYSTTITAFQQLFINILSCPLGSPSQYLLPSSRKQIYPSVRSPIHGTVISAQRLPSQEFQPGKHPHMNEVSNIIHRIMLPSLDRPRWRSWADCQVIPTFRRDQQSISMDPIAGHWTPIYPQGLVALCEITRCQFLC